jgi:hypothetical protein
LEIDRTDSHIPSAPATTASLTENQNPKGAFPSSPDLRSLQAHSSIGKDCEELVRAAYGSNYARLAEIKKKYDPTNVLRLDQNIKPE